MTSRDNGMHDVAFLVQLVDRVTDICVRDKMFLDQDMSAFTDIAEIVEEIMAQETKAANEPRCAVVSALYPADRTAGLIKRTLVENPSQDSLIARPAMDDALRHFCEREKRESAHECTYMNGVYRGFVGAWCELFAKDRVAYEDDRNLTTGDDIERTGGQNVAE